jgi:DNA-binding PadR family transcriptional regulator
VTKLSKAMVRMLVTIIDGGWYQPQRKGTARTLDGLAARGLAEIKVRNYARGEPHTYRLTPFGRETAERLARGR